MQLTTFKYLEYPETPNEWRVSQFELGAVTLLVSKNAIGKTRTLNAISALGALLAGLVKPMFGSGHFEVEFKTTKEKYNYLIKVDHGVIKQERLSINDETRFYRNSEGYGKIYNARTRQQVEFQMPENGMPVLYRRDLLQHPYLEELFTWGDRSRNFRFGSSLGKDMFWNFPQNGAHLPNDTRDTSAVALVFHRGTQVNSDLFKSRIVADMKAIGYDIEDIVLAQPALPMTLGLSKGAMLGIAVKEAGVNALIDQNTMSQGMFRALSILVQTNYYELTGDASCIIVDDIGEGLDYARSTALIKILVNKALSKGVQLIMSSNDRFIMNAVPLKHWAVLQRSERGCKLSTYFNNKEKFEEFSYTGLNNFDFFSTGFLDEQ